jgi:hypothetical protein
VSSGSGTWGEEKRDEGRGGDTKKIWKKNWQKWGSNEVLISKEGGYYKCGDGDKEV